MVHERDEKVDKTTSFLDKIKDKVHDTLKETVEHQTGKPASAGTSQHEKEGESSQLGKSNESRETSLNDAERSTRTGQASSI
ncbi:hypothetical protein H310_09136 [Aphanomyces invadans]|uniref:Uncharacterized protein n=1 Tax=Aphanomyces invadans TaxID=157072 RepID=A0A024TUX3_9STRA|nr:hypothetical protein H310_09136 [Aphanomyces invadans]ETV97784.1 hypothetical protein H310_09136 [Aphanomyces invadans]|eukprot:XP_008873345.1 hypothetical protein H310_09136 [Aphanomyces invadans]